MDAYFLDSPRTENCIAIIFNKKILGWQQPKMIQGNKHLARLGAEAYQNSHDRDKVGLWSTGLLEPTNMTVTMRKFHCRINLFHPSFIRHLSHILSIPFVLMQDTVLRRSFQPFYRLFHNFITIILSPSLLLHLHSWSMIMYPANPSLPHPLTVYILFRCAKSRST
jgi:hypothetical protein